MLMPGASLQPLRVTCNPLTEWRVNLITLPILPLVYYPGNCAPVAIAPMSLRSQPFVLALIRG
ncbi:hypothetical protein OKW30_007559 [Paraburkholderia sp. Clong3]|nr:hypothetical protein [Paraburkholderia sp. CI2]